MAVVQNEIYPVPEHRKSSNGPCNCFLHNNTVLSMQVSYLNEFEPSKANWKHPAIESALGGQMRTIASVRVLVKLC